MMAFLMHVDVCPLERENYNKFQDEDGCPDIIQHVTSGDSDSDGILNSFDSCPYQPETYNRFQDTDGCPDFIADNKLSADTDGDGIVDNLDLCPNTT